MNTYNGRTAPSIERIRSPHIWRRIRYRRLVVGRWPNQREIIVAEIRSVVLSEPIR